MSQENTSLCFQCAKCSSGCPVAGEMDLLPHQIIHLASLGLRERALRAKTIWLCAGCYACAVRCPNDINITAVMDELREEAIRTGIECPRPNVRAFHEAFLRDMIRRGRIHEMRMMAEYNLAIRKPFNDAALAPQMFLKGRLRLLPPRPVRGFKNWVKQSCNR